MVTSYTSEARHCGATKSPSQVWRRLAGLGGLLEVSNRTKAALCTACIAIAIAIAFVICATWPWVPLVVIVAAGALVFLAAIYVAVLDYVEGAI